MAERVIVRDFFYMVLIFAIAAGTMSYIFSLLRTGGTNPDEKAEGLTLTAQDEINFNRSFRRVDEISSTMESAHNNLSKVRVEGTNPASTVGAFVSTSWAVVKGLMGYVGIVDDSINALPAYLHIPYWIPTLITSFFIGIFIFTIISLFFGKDI